jgi:hypothetical protein
MKATILYHPKSDHEGIVLDYARDYKNRTGKEFELVSLETMEGSEMAKLYDVTAYPAVLVMRDDGHLQQMWQGETLPLMSEIEAYSRE